jgi:hypothetical protein
VNGVRSEILTDGPITTLIVDTETDAIEALKAANTLGFGVILRDRWQLDPDGDGSSTHVWDVTVLGDTPEGDLDEGEVAP